jgi:hypothetical protein
MNGCVYNESFFDAQVQGALDSARLVVPAVLRFVQPRRVLDVGCGRGAWLRAFKEAGVEHVQGLDGDYVRPESLLIDPADFRATDLGQPFVVDERVDMAVCLEVAEHLPASAAPGLVRSLTAAAPLVLFSAAIPGQGGTNHINEQPPAYWQALFAAHDFTRLDLLRPLIWQDPRIDFWYRQNILFYAAPEALQRWEALRMAAAQTRDSELELVHRKFLRGPDDDWLVDLLHRLPRALVRAIRNRVSFLPR